jgi:hypothetical protein
MIITGVLVIISLVAIFYISALIVKNPGSKKQKNDDLEAAKSKNDDPEAVELNANNDGSAA